MLHVVCFIWATSKYYSTPARIIVLLQEICSLLICQVSHAVVLTLAPQPFLENGERSLLMIHRRPSNMRPPNNILDSAIQIVHSVSESFSKAFLKLPQTVPMQQAWVSLLLTSLTDHGDLKAEMLYLRHNEREALFPCNSCLLHLESLSPKNSFLWKEGSFAFFQTYIWNYFHYLIKQAWTLFDQGPLNLKHHCLLIITYSLCPFSMECSIHDYSPPPYTHNTSTI